MINTVINIGNVTTVNRSSMTAPTVWCLLANIAESQMDVIIHGGRTTANIQKFKSVSTFLVIDYQKQFGKYHFSLILESYLLQKRNKDVLFSKSNLFPLDPPIGTEHCDWLYGIFGHETSCTRYWTCWNGTATEQLCIGGLLYNENAHSCDWPENVDGCQKHREYQTFEVNTYFLTLCRIKYVKYLMHIVHNTIFSLEFYYYLMVLQCF